MAPHRQQWHRPSGTASSGTAKPAAAPHRQHHQRHAATAVTAPPAEAPHRLQRHRTACRGTAPPAVATQAAAQLARGRGSPRAPGSGSTPASRAGSSGFSSSGGTRWQVGHGSCQAGHVRPAPPLADNQCGLVEGVAHGQVKGGAVPGAALQVRIIQHGWQHQRDNCAAHRLISTTRGSSHSSLPTTADWGGEGHTPDVAHATRAARNRPS